MGIYFPTDRVLVGRKSKSLEGFREALSVEDRDALDNILSRSEISFVGAEQDSDHSPMEVLLLTMLLEEHKRVVGLAERVRKLETSLVMQLSDSPPRFIPP